MGNRRTNKMNMTITEQLEDLKEQVCCNVCKYWEQAEGKALELKKLELDNRQDFEWHARIQVELHEHCEKCVLNEL